MSSATLHDDLVWVTGGGDGVRRVTSITGSVGSGRRGGSGVNGIRSTLAVGEYGPAERHPWQIPDRGNREPARDAPLRPRASFIFVLISQLRGVSQRETPSAPQSDLPIPPLPENSPIYRLRGAVPSLRKFCLRCWLWLTPGGSPCGSLAITVRGGASRFYEGQASLAVTGWTALPLPDQGSLCSRVFFLFAGFLHSRRPHPQNAVGSVSPARSVSVTHCTPPPPSCSGDSGPSTIERRINPIPSDTSAA